MHEVAKDGVILDAGMLSDTYVPDTLIARETQVAELSRWLVSATETRTPTHLWLHGPSGTGKTATAVNVVNRLQESHGIENALINCWEHSSYFEVLDALVVEFRILRAEQHRSSHKLDKIGRHLGDKPCIIVADEVDRMTPSERSATLYNLAKLGVVSLVCISNDNRALHGLDERVRSRLSPVTIHFPKYKPDQLHKLLRHRANRALIRGAVPDRAVEALIEVADGDARVAIRMLRDAALAAEREGGREIAVHKLEGSARQIREAERLNQLETLTEDHRILCQVLQRFGQLTSGGLYRGYLHRCSQVGRKPLALRTFSNYANQLVQSGLITCESVRGKSRERLFRIVR